MLSVENPPRDPSQISQLKSSASGNSSSDEKASSDNKQQLQLVDLLKSDLDDNNNNIHNPTPKFSIRGYVFNTRSKDIKNNWPFSQENLQLCLKHGVTDLLPPFQSPQTVRNPLLESCTGNSLLNEKENLSNSNGEPSGQSDHAVFVDSKNAECNPKLAEDCSNTNPSGSEGDKEFPSTITSRSCSEIDSLPTNKSPSLESETDIFPELSVAKPEVISSASNKTENTTQVPVKKCRLIVKLSSIANSTTKEDNTAVNNFMVSEAMASKVCPVCKTFSSSSNTTLNAHIDQCLSAESTTKWTTNSKVIKHRIKPRKMKSMVEIYATAAHYTLEELDRRNGTNWATNSTLLAQEMETSADQRKEGPSPTDFEETPDEGAVYIDANGTKVRILSKSNEPSVFSKVVDVPRSKKFINRDKVSKFPSAKKKKQNQVPKQHKFLKHGKKMCPPQPYQSSEIKNNQDRNFSEEESLEKEECMTQQIKAQTEVKFSRPDLIRGWACSKRTTKKFSGRDDHQDSGSCDNGDFPVENNQLSLGDSCLRKNCVRRTPNTFENSLSSPGSSKRFDVSSHEHHDECREQPSLRKRLGLSSVESQTFHERKRSQAFPGYPDHNLKRTRSNEHHNQEDHASLLSKRKVKMNASVDRNADRLVLDPKLSADRRTLMSKATRFSSLRNKLSAGQKYLPDSKFNLKGKGKCSPFKKSRVRFVSESNEEVIRAVDRQHVQQNPGEDGGRIERTWDIESVDRTEVLKIRKSGGGSMVSRKEENMTLKTPRSESISYHHDAADQNGSFKLGNLTAGRSAVAESTGKNMHHTHAENFDIGPPSEVASGRAFMDFRNSLDAEFHGLAGSSDAHCDSQCFIEAYKESPLFEAEAPTSSAEPILSGGQDMFCAAEAPENMIRGNVHVMADLDSSDVQGNYFAEVDPIPIPGPPGSFLPSPGHMDSEDLQGNSSLTSSRVQSSDDHQELVDHSSDSPVSATSTISNSTLARSDSKSSGRLSVGHPPFPDKMRSGSIAVANGDPTVENSSPALKATDAGVERITLDELKVNSTITEKGAFRFKSDQPCCCSRKEGFMQNVSLNCQESQLLRRRTMAAVVVSSNGNEMTGDIDRRVDSLRSDMSSSISGQSPGSETAIKSPVGHTQSRISADSEVKFPNRDDRESCSPSASNPVFRLMGKNLMVVKKDENLSPQLKQSQLSPMIGHTNPQVAPLSGVSIGNAQNDNQRIGHHVVSHGPFCFDQTESRKRVMQHPEMRWSDGSGSHENPGTPQLSPLTSPAIFPSRGAVRGFMGSSMHHDYIVGYPFPTEQRQPLNRLDPSITCDADKFVKSASLRWRNANPTVNAVKEVIVIDDTPENEVDSTTVATHNEGMGSSTSVGKSITTASACDSRHANTFHSYQQYDSAAFSGSPVDANFRMPPPSGVNGSSIKWNWTPEGSNALRAGPLVITASPTAQQRSKLYTSSNF